MFERNIEQRNEIIDRCRRRIPYCGNKGSNFKQELGLALACCFSVERVNFAGVDCCGELMLFILELDPLLMQFSDRGVQCLDHVSPPMVGVEGLRPFDDTKE
jgi:hypothetical protein